VTGSGFVHLHNHTEYSMLDGAARIGDLMTASARMGMGALGITDHGTLFGAYEFWKKATTNGIKPIIGIEAYLTPGTSRFDKTRVRWGGGGRADVSGGGAYTHFTMWAETSAGMHNLFRMSSIASIEGHYFKPRIDRELLATYGKGIIATTGCPSGEVQTLLRLGQYERAVASAAELRDIFGPGNYFCELMDHGLGIEREVRADLLRLARALDLPLVATNDLHYVEPGDAVPHAALLCVQSGSTLDDPRRFKFDADEFYLKSPAQMRDYWRDVPQACDNTLLIAERCDAQFTEGVNLMPRFPVPDGESEESWFVHEVELGLARRFPGGLPQDVRARADYETSIICKMGFPGYFLVTADLIGWAKDQGIRVGPGRGSVAGSLVAYAMGITELDPLRHGLLFERFLNPDRISMPDIDIDFDESRRNEVIKYVTDRYGDERVAQIVTYGTIKAKQALKDAARVLGHPFAVGDRLTSALPAPVMGKDIPLSGAFDPRHERYGEAEKFREIYETDDEAREVVDLARGLEGLKRQWGVHAAGVIMSREPLIDHIPIMRRDVDGATITQFDYPACETLGLLKMDFLGLRNLTIIDNALRTIVRNGRAPVDLDTISHDLDDPATYELLARGDTLGVFQLDGGPMRGLLRTMRPDHFEDISAVLALYRPGPMSAGSHTNYALRKNGLQPIEAIHPELAKPLDDILSTTYGLIVYQEQVMAIAQRVAGYSLSRADLLRKAMGKKKREILDHEFGPFRDGMRANGYSDDAVNTLWEILVPFSDYAFNKCTAGDTVVDGLSVRQTKNGKASGFTGTIEQMYERLHGRDNAAPGECSYCRDRGNAMKTMRMCSPCASWRSKVGMRGLWTAGIVDGRVAPVQIRDIHRNGPREVFRVLLADGRHIDATADHRHLTPAGWRTVAELAAGDTLMTHRAQENGSGVTPRVVMSDQGWAGRPSTWRAPAIDGRNRPSLGGHCAAVSKFRRARLGTACDHCGTPGGHGYEVAHLDQNAVNPDAGNLAWLCNSCHKRHDYARGSRHPRWTRPRLIEAVPIVSVESRGFVETYDVEVDSRHHSWSANGGILTHNSHTAGYGLVSYWTAYLKANYPVEYMASVLTSVSGEKDKAAVYLSECRRMGIKVLPPDVNLSDPEFTPSGDEIRFGLSSVRNVGEAAVSAIVATREGGGRFASFGDFLRRVPGAVRNRKVVDSLIKGGAFDSLGHTRRGLAEAADEALALSAGAAARRASGQVSLFEAHDGGQDAASDREAVVPDGEWGKHELLTFEREMLGLYVSDHPLSGCEGTLARLADCTVASIHGPDGRADGAEITLAGIISVLERKVTKKGKPWATATVEDTTGGIEVLFFPSTYELVADLLGKDRAVAVRGRINRRDETPVLFASDVTPIDLGEPGGAIRLFVESSRCTPPVAARLAEILADHPGEAPVLLAVRTGASSRALARLAACAPSPDLFARVRALLGPASC